MFDIIPLRESADCLCLASRRAALMLTRTFDRHLRPHGIRATQFSLLSVLLLEGPMTIGELAERLGVERTTLTRNLEVIEALGWIDLRPGEASRARQIEATERARDLVAEALPAWRMAQRAAKVEIGASGVAALHALADSMAA